MEVTPIISETRMPEGSSKPEVIESPTPVEVLEELFLLLEEFGPQWYTEEHHNRAMAALGLNE